MSEDGNISTLVVTDINCEQKTIIFDNKDHKFTTDGTFALGNGLEIKIKKGKVDSIKKGAIV